MLLYPRLPRVVAVRLAQERASLLPNVLVRASSVTHPDAIYAPTGGNRVDRKHLETLRTLVRQAAKDAGYPHPPNEKKKRAFDAASGRILHSRMNISPAEAAQAGVWQFMACVMLPELVRWRFPGTQDGTSIERFLGGVRNVFQRVWWRAYILGMPDRANPYELLTLMGEDELVQIMERPNLAGSPRLALRVSLEFLSTVKADRNLDRMRLMREVQKRLMRLSTFVSFDAVDESTLNNMLEQIFEEAATNLA